MALTELERHIFAYFVAKGAADFSMDPRWWPPIELSSIVEDKIRFAVSRFWLAGRPPVENAARAFLDVLIERGAFATKEGDYGPMYQFQRPAYRTALEGLQTTNPIVAQAKARGDEFWEDAFERLAG